MPPQKINLLLICVGLSHETEATVWRVLNDEGLSVACIGVSPSELRSGPDDLELRLGAADMVVFLLGKSLADVTVGEAQLLASAVGRAESLGVPSTLLLFGDERRGFPYGSRTPATAALHMGPELVPMLTLFARVVQATLPATRWSPILFESHPDEREILTTFFHRPLIGKDYALTRLTAANRFPTLALDYLTPKADLQLIRDRGVERGMEDVTCSVYASPIAAPGDEILVQVFAHLPGHKAQVTAKAAAADPLAGERASEPLGSVARDERLGFHLSVNGLKIDDPNQERVWRGAPVVVPFVVTVPPRMRPRSAVAKLLVTVGGVPVGHVAFTLQVVTRKAKQQAIDTGMVELLGTLSRYREAFISYASEDRVRATEGAQMLAASKIKFFQDILNLDPGERWKRQLYKHIDSCDVFFLFWSTAAKRSTWVRRETQYARRLQGGEEHAPPEIVPIIIEGPPPVTPPRSLNFLHFNDKFAYLLKGVEEEARLKRKRKR